MQRLKRKDDILYLLILGMLPFFLSNCEYDPEEPVPSYLTIKNVSLATTPGQGAPTHLIKDIWVIIDSVGEHGIYPVKGRIPVIAKGQKKLLLLPGVRVNGVRNESIIYEPYKAIPLVHEFSPGRVDTVDLEFSYKDRTKFPFVEDFESSANWSSQDTSKYLIKKWQLVPSTQVLNGTKEARLTLLPKDSIFRAELTSGEWINGAAFVNKKVYMEIDVNSKDLQLVLGFYIKEGTQFRKTLNAFILPDSVGQWRKFYFDFTRVLEPNANKYYKVLFFTSVDPTTPKEAELRIDNLKIVTY